MRSNESIRPSAAAVKRGPMSKRKRFDVFKRDVFTCRYCGAQPPDIVLVVDHVVPVSEGGPNTLDNLITACEACNQGKGARSLGDIPPRVDADLRYLELQQEIAEMRRYQEKLHVRDAAMDELVATLGKRFEDRARLNHSARPFVRKLLAKYDMEIVGEALEIVTTRIWAGALYRLAAQYEPYAWVVARNLEAERNE